VREPTARRGWDTGDWAGQPPVAVHPYDPAWPARYRLARRAIVAALAGLGVRVEHVGSTAVPGLAARDGVDILIGLRDMADAEACVERLLALGYQYHFSKPDWVHLSGNGHKLHLSPIASAAWDDLVRFRDHLRAHPETAAAYQRLKQELARAHGPDGLAYVQGKTAFVRAVLDQARAGGPATPP
jgi:GrpB-like predicted nucleotidyltransferase (UPF0157 family)